MDYIRITRIIALFSFSREEIARWVEITNNSMELFNTLNGDLRSMAIAQTVRLDVIDHPIVRSFLITLSKSPQSAILVNARVISKLVEKIEHIVSITVASWTFHLTYSTAT